MATGQDVLLAHSSDVHVDDDLGIGGETGLEGLRRVLATARAAAADVLLLAGDTFDNHRISPGVLEQARALLAEAGLPVVMLPGNHDPVLPNCLYRRAGIADLPGIAVLGVTHPPAILFPQFGLEIIGRAHIGFGDMPPLSPAMPRTARWRVVMAHGHYVPTQDRAREAHRAWKFGDADLAAAAADYIALGHWDRPLRIGDARSRAFYSGSPDLARTINLVRLSREGDVAVERAPLVSA